MAAYAVIARIGRADPHLVLGDLSYAGDDSEIPWCELVTSTLGDEAPVAIVAGMLAIRRASPTRRSPRTYGSGSAARTVPLWRRPSGRRSSFRAWPLR